MQYKQKPKATRRNDGFMSEQANNAPCTENRMAFLKELLTERKAPKALVKQINKEMDGMTNAQAKVWIGVLMPMERIVNPDAANEPGYYILDGVVYEVKVSREGRPYALVSDGFNKFDYAPGAIRRLRKQHKMTKKQLAEAGL